MAPHGQVRHHPLLAPDPHLPAVTASSDVAPIGTDGDGEDGIECLGEDHLAQSSPSKTRILHLDALQVSLANGEPGEIQAPQVATEVFQQADDVGGTIALGGDILCAELL